MQSFFLSFAMKPALSAAQAIEEIRKNIAGIADWDSQYLLGGVYGLQEEYLKNYLAKFWLDFEKG